VRAKGLWHPALLAHLAGLGHGQTLVVADPGLPIPRGIPTVDLVWAPDEPRFLPVLAAVLAELVVESAAVAEELRDQEVVESLTQHLGGVALSRIPHGELKLRAAEAHVVVRTGETTPYANIVLTAGVPF
jgi:D-ribose pyranase